MEARDVEKANAWVEAKDYTDVDFTTEEIVDFLENPGADVELTDLELEFVAGGTDSEFSCCLTDLADMKAYDDELAADGIKKYE